MKQHNETEPFFITAEIEAELIATGYEFAPPGHIRTKSISDLFGWQPGETLSEALSRHMEKVAIASGTKPRGEGL